MSPFVSKHLLFPRASPLFVVFLFANSIQGQGTTGTCSELALPGMTESFVLQPPATESFCGVPIKRPFNTAAMELMTPAPAPQAQLEHSRCLGATVFTSTYLGMAGQYTTNNRNNDNDGDIVYNSNSARKKVGTATADGDGFLDAGLNLTFAVINSDSLVFALAATPANSATAGRGFDSAAFKSRVRRVADCFADKAASFEACWASWLAYWSNATDFLQLEHNQEVFTVSEPFFVALC